ncbi:MAG: hypothetical protein WD795_12555 [Woeseia sp.]
MSAYILGRLLPAPRKRFDTLVDQLAVAADPVFALAGLNDFLSACTAAELTAATAEAPRAALPPLRQNYLAAMVEYAAGRNDMAAPAWTRAVAPLEHPWFGSDLQNLRLYLLTHSPAPFRRRNIFIDSTLGDRV